MSKVPTPCSCGVEGCRELGWPHDWDPLAGGDTEPYEPGDIIVRRDAAGKISARFVVMDPPHSTHGKLRLLREQQGTEMRTWWTPDWLPRRHERLARPA
jgi:hypothetical protein